MLKIHYFMRFIIIFILIIFKWNLHLFLLLFVNLDIIKKCLYVKLLHYRLLYLPFFSESINHLPSNEWKHICFMNLIIFQVI